MLDTPLERIVSRLVAPVAALAAVCFALAARSEPPTPLGPPFEVAPPVDYDELRRPAVAMDADGDFVVVWDAYSYFEGREGIFGRRFSSSGGPLSGIFTVGAPLESDDLEQPDVAMDADGDFVVVWESYSYVAEREGIFGRRFSSVGGPLANAFQIAAPVGNRDPELPAVAADADGDFVVVWRVHDEDLSYDSIAGRRFDSAGTALGSEFEVVSPARYADDPDVAMDADGDFVVVWDDDYEFGTAVGILASRYDSAGAPLGAEFEVAAENLDGEYLSEPAVAMGLDGDFVVVWDNDAYDPDGISARRYDSTGGALGSEFAVVAEEEGYFRSPDVAADAEGGFVVVWNQEQYQAGGFSGIRAQRYDSDGAASGGDFEVVVEGEDDYLRRPAVGAEANGDFVVAWEAYYCHPGCEGIQARRFAAPEPGAVALQLAALASLVIVAGTRSRSR